MFFAGFWATWNLWIEVIFKGEDATPTTLIEIMDKWTKIVHNTVNYRLEYNERNLAQRQTTQSYTNKATIDRDPNGEANVIVKRDRAWKKGIKNKGKSYAWIACHFIDKLDNRVNHTINTVVRASSPLNTKLRAIWYALQWLQENNYGRVEIHTDCRNTIQYVNKVEAAPTTMQAIINDIEEVSIYVTLCIKVGKYLRKPMR